MQRSHQENFGTDVHVAQLADVCNLSDLCLSISVVRMVKSQQHECGPSYNHGAQEVRRRQNRTYSGWLKLAITHDIALLPTLADKKAVFLEATELPAEWYSSRPPA